MANTVVSLFSIVLLCLITTQGSKTLHLNNESLTSYNVINDIDGGICKKMVETKGYTCEEHQVITDDGYILSLQRIPVGRSGKKADKPPVLVVAGVFCDAIVWLVNPPEESLAFLLADNGYDVWLTNTRGTKYSKGHTSLGPYDKAYWDWTWEELTRYDLHTFVQYVYDHTGQRMHYVGQSLGTLMALAAFSQGQLLNKLRSASLVSPISYLNQTTSLFVRVAAERYLINELYWLGIHEFIPNGDLAVNFLRGVCGFLNFSCGDLLALFGGPNCCLNSTIVDVFLDNEPQSTSTKNLVHLCQMIRTGTIAKYDYGQVLNMKHYGQPDPPLYDLTQIPNEFPLFLIHGGQDALGDVYDMKVLLNDLKNHDRNKLVVVFQKDYGHVDFVMGFNAKEMIYDPVMDFIKLN